MTARMTELRVCTTCEPPHVENCPECLGWGFWVDRSGHRHMVSGQFFDDPPVVAAVDRCSVCDGVAKIGAACPERVSSKG